MKTAGKRIVSVILCISMLLGLIAVGNLFDDQTYAYIQSNLDYSNNKAYSCGTFPDASKLKTNPEEDLGEKDNPFVVLEIVPTYDQGSFGYFIPGCEPINMEAIERDYATHSGNMGLMKDAYTVRESDIYSLYEDIPADTPYNITTTMGWNADDLTDYMARDFALGYTNTNVNIGYNMWYHKPDDEFKREGYFVKVESGGNYSRVPVQTGDGHGTPYNKDPNNSNYYFKYDENGEYKWYNKGDTLPCDESDTSKVVAMTRNDVFKCHVTKLVHNDIFVQKALSNKSTDFISNVITITPEDLNTEANLKLIDKADLIYIHSGKNTDVMMDIWQKYNIWGKTTENNRYNPDLFDKHDLTNQEVLAIMKRMGTDNPTALLFETPAVKITDRSDLNAYKLMLMVTQFKPADFCNKLGLLSAVETASAGKDKLYYPAKKMQDGQLVDAPEISNFWTPTTVNSPYSSGTFAYNTNGDDLTVSDMRFDGGNFGGYNVFEKILTYHGDNSLLQEFLTKNDITQSSDSPLNGGNTIQDLKDYYGNKDIFSMQEIMKFILSVPQYTPKLRVLELEPCQQFIYQNDTFKQTVDGIEYDWVKYYENLFPWYEADQDSGSWVEDPDRLQVTTMTTAEFIGNIGRYEYGQVDELNNPVTLTIDSSDDLIAKYDLIIVGSMQDASNGLNGYNDVNLGNLIYTSVGDLMYSGTGANGTSWDKDFLNDYKNYKMRYSGNDITLKKMYEMEDFLKAGKPIVVDQNLFTVDGSEIDTTKVDKNSKLYDLLTWDDKNSNAEEKILRYNDYSPKQMKKIIARSRCQIIFVSGTDGYPLEYGYSEKSVKLDTVSNKTISGVIDHENYQPKDASGNAVLSYHFYINGVVGQNYEVHLCLDSDGDGVYRGSLKEHSEIDNMNEALGKTDSYDGVEKALNMNIYTEDGSECKNGELEPNKRYYATYTLPKSRLGMVPWKLEVNEVGNSYLRSSAIDYTAFEKTNEKAKIKVLQMCLPPMRSSSSGRVSAKPYQDKDAIYNNSLWSNDDRFDAFTRWAVDFSAYDYYNPDYDYTLKSKDITADIINKGGAQNGRKQTVEKFEKYLGAVEEFDVSIQLLKNSDWYTYFGDLAKDDKGNSLKDDQKTRLENWKTFLSEYDMVVLGFIDSNSFSEDPVFVGGIEDFISQGKSMIFSHDLVQSADAYNIGNYGDFSPWLRTISGQRRAYYNKQEDGTYIKSYSNTWLNGEEIFKQQDFTSYFNSVKGNDYSGMFFHKYTDEKEDTLNKANDGIFDYDYESVEKEFLNTYTCEVSDNAAQMYARYKSCNTPGDTKTDRIPSSGTTDITKGKSWPDSNSGTSFVRLANNGQITCYPYQLDDVIQVLNTHVQNYQLDLEYETMGDVNVWFNLTDNYDPDIKDNTTLKNQSTSKNTTDVYSSKMQDSRNSFYIYNKGNITYTGSGHGDAQGSNPNALMPDDEVKLFVNTMISAYRPPEEGPYVSIDNANSVSDNGDALIYVDYDTVKDASDADVADSTVLDESIVTVGGEKMVKVAFTLRDDEATDESQIYTDSDLEERKWLLNIKDHNGNDLVLSADNTIYQDSKSVNLAANGKTSKFYIAYPNKQYVIYVPYEDVKNGGNLCYQFTAYRTYVKEKRKCRTSQEITNLNVMILPLFNLN